MAKMSPAALSRCRSLVVSERRNSHWLISVFDPKRKSAVRTYMARVEADVRRITGVFMQTFQVPKENVCFRDEALAKRLHYTYIPSGEVIPWFEFLGRTFESVSSSKTSDKG